MPGVPVTESSDMILTMCAVKKSFGGVHALRGVDLEVAKGEIHALIGENGAGKSTLMKVLSGAHKRDSGDMTLDGAAFEPLDPLHARKSGISMVYQELTLALHMTVEQNLMLGIESSSFGFIRRGEFSGRIQKALETLEHPDITPSTRVGDLSPGGRQLVEIARGLITDTKVFVLDEPTSSLSRVDVDHLFEVMKTLKGRGVSIIYISHFLEEVKRIADRFTVIRDGETVGKGIVKDTTTEGIIELMVGRSLNEMFPSIPHDIADDFFTVKHLNGGKLPLDVSFSVRRGEIMGIAGLVGAGRTETLRAVFGLAEMVSGSVSIEDFTLKPSDQSPYGMISRGIALLSEDRKNEGLSLPQSIATNITLSSLGRLSKWGLVSEKTINDVSKKSASKLAIKHDKVTDRVDSLSGGNQQKVALARLLEEDAEVFLLDEPTRGVDVGSKVEIFKLIGELASRGKAVIIVSSYLPELLGVCDTLAVMHRGVLGPKRTIGDWDEYTVMNEATSGVEITA